MIIIREREGGRMRGGGREREGERERGEGERGRERESGEGNGEWGSRRGQSGRRSSLILILSDVP